MEKQYEYQSAQAMVQQQWETEETYHRSHFNGPLYSIDTPPPTVSGSLHIGHIFSYTQTDIIARYKRMQGHTVFYPFGFDDNGLPTERFVEKKHNVVAHRMTRSAFTALCLQETVAVEKQFEELWRRMGLSADWSACYSTISPTTQKISQESFIRLYQANAIYRKEEPALYCTACRTSVAQAELDDKEVASFFNDVTFKTSGGQNLIIGTTRPELLSSCVALVYNPSDPRYKNLAGQQAVVPLFNTVVPIIADDAVAIDKGTGLVMCCTFGDKTDVAWFKKHKLPFKQSIGLDGKWLPTTGILALLNAQDARTKVIEKLKTAGVLSNQRAITHTVNVHERCKREIEYTILPQWFINILDHKQKFIDLADQIAWHPSFMKSRYQNWVENLSWDWCISRQRFFGIPFPVWHCTSCKAVIVADIKALPLDPQETPYTGACPSCKGTSIVGDADVMDTWNTSSLTPYLCQQLFEPDRASAFELPSTKFLPMSMRPQAHDIIRTWAFDTIVKVWLHHGTIPWKDIVISGHVLSDAQEKLSKSKENAPFAPENLLKKYPADAIRFWTASGSLGHDVPFSENQIRIGQKLITKLWNAFRFINEHVAAAPSQQPAQLGALNEWILHNSTTCFSQYQQYFMQHEFGLALNQVEHFFWHDFCDNYLELVKDQLFNPTLYQEQEVLASRWTLYQVGLRILQLYAPYIPHITETIYQNIYKQKERTASLHQTTFAAVQQPHDFPESATTMFTVLQVVNAVRKLKSEHQLSLKTPLSELTVYGTEDMVSLRSLERLLKGVTQAQKIIFATTAYPQPHLEQRDANWQAHVPLHIP